MQFLTPKPWKKPFILLLLKKIQYACVMFYENSFIAAAFTLKLWVINPKYLQKQGKTFMKLTHLWVQWDKPPQL